jgi:predicted glycosyltransferase
MKIIFAVNHPAQYHLLKNPYKALKDKGHEIIFVIRDKDILEKLMISEDAKYVRVTKKRVGQSKFSILAKGLVDLVIQDINLFRIAKKFTPDLMVGTDYCITHVGRLLHIPSIVLNEDDFEINKFFCRLAYPFSSSIISPTVCNVGRYQAKKINYDGYQKLSYLHPAVFTPDPEIVSKYTSPAEKFFLLRLVSFSAGHDVEMKHGGLQNLNIKELIDILLPHGKVFITSESKIPSEFEPYMLEIDFKDIHHLLAYATLFIADSQSMIVESAMLGTPCIRYNSFVGKISVLEELEKKYGLTIGIQNNNPEILIAQVTKILQNNNLKNEFKQHKAKMLSEKINVSSFLVWFIENFPQSKEIMRQNPDYQYNFK